MDLALCHDWPTRTALGWGLVVDGTVGADRAAGNGGGHGRQGAAGRCVEAKDATDERHCRMGVADGGSGAGGNSVRFSQV